MAEPKKILIVEDDEILAKLYKTKLAKEGFEIQVASDGQEGFEKAKSFLPDLIILDLIMPRVDGFGFLQKVNQDPELSSKKIPISVLSNLGQESDIKKATDMGAKDFFVKADISLTQMIDKIKAALK